MFSDANKHSMLSVVMLGVIMQSVVMLGVIMQSVVMLGVIMQSVVMLGVVVLSVVAPPKRLSTIKGLRHLTTYKLYI
jgi:hypothetical protein